MIELGLQRISRLLHDIPLSWRAIHVAGTNGKGSVCSYISEMLNVYNRSSYRRRKGQTPIRHGRFTSPHLVERWDCVQISNGNQMEVISPEVFREVEKAVQARSEREVVNASEFEILTATAFEVFAKAEIELGVVEVGMGGRLDATNVLGQPVIDVQDQRRQAISLENYRPLPLITAITRIGKDHQQFLGDTCAKIAYEKAGIIKPGVPLAYYEKQDVPEIIDVFLQQAKKLGAPIILPKQLQLPPIDGHILPDGWRKYNGELALTCTWTSLTSLGRLPGVLPATPDQDYHALRELHQDMRLAIKDHIFSGRQETLSLAPLTRYDSEVLLDGSHNQQGIELLANTLEVHRGQASSRPIIYVTAISNSQDRKAEDILRPLLRPGDSIFAVEFGLVAGMPWVEPKSSKEIIETARRLVPGLHTASSYSRDILAAIKAACKLAVKQPDSKLVICGSLYLAGDVHRLLRDASRVEEWTF